MGKAGSRVSGFGELTLKCTVPMDQFTSLYFDLDRAKGTNAKVDAMVRYFGVAPAADAAWAVALLCGSRRFRRPVTGTLLRRLAGEIAELPAWLVDECYSVVGDLGEAMALLIPDAKRSPSGSADVDGTGVVRSVEVAEPDKDEEGGVSLRALIEEHTLPLAGLDEARQAEAIRAMWMRLSAAQRLVWHKIMLGSFRVGVAEKNVAKALAVVAGVDEAEMAWRLSGHWTPTANHYVRTISGDATSATEVRGEMAQAAPVAGRPKGRSREAMSRLGDVGGPGEDERREVVEGDNGTGSGTGTNAEPYPFYLAYQVDAAPTESTFGALELWQVEWKYDGIRLQIVRRADGVMLWSRGDELITEAFPEIALEAHCLPVGTVLDGELLAWEGGRPLPFSMLQRRLNRKRVELMLWDEVPVAFRAFDLIEEHGVDVRSLPLAERRCRLETVLQATFGPDAPLAPAPVIEHVEDWAALASMREESRARGVEGVMLKRRTSAYGVGRRRGDWWKWKIDPFTVDCVLIAAQRGHGRRAGLYTDFTFAVWDERTDERTDEHRPASSQVDDADPDREMPEPTAIDTGGTAGSARLVPVTKAYSGLTDAEFREVNRFIREHTIGDHGPYRTVEPRLVFEIGFEGIQASNRHKSGIALRFPRMLRWRTDKGPAEADTLQSLQRLLAAMERRHEVEP